MTEEEIEALKTENNKMIRARNEVFYNILYKDITHDELVSLFEQKFGITAWQMDNTNVSDGNTPVQELVQRNIAKREEIRKKKSTPQQ